MAAVDPRSGSRFTELRTTQEVSIVAGSVYTASLQVRHDGDFEAQIVFRTRDGFEFPETVRSELSKGGVILSATLPPQVQDGRLRQLHLANLYGDYSYLELSKVQLVKGDEISPYQPRARLTSPSQGYVWWIGLGLLLLVASSLASKDYEAWVSGAAVTGMLAGLFIQCLIGALQLMSASGPSRASGSLFDPNVLAHVAVVVGLASFVAAPWPRRAALVGLSLVLTVLVLADSHAGYLGLALAVGGVLWIHARSAVLKLVTSLAVASGLVILVVLLQPVELLRDGNVQARTEVSGSAWSLMLDNPLAGIGHGNLAIFHEFAVPSNPGPRYRADHAHSLLSIGAEFGLPTLVLFVGLYFALLCRLWRLRKYSAWLLLSVALMLNLLDFTLFNSALLIPLALVVFRAGMRFDQAVSRRDGLGYLN